MILEPGEKIDPETGEITTDSIVADALRRMDGHFGKLGSPRSALYTQGATVAEVIDEPEGVQLVLDVEVIQTPTEWFPGTAIPAHDGEYEVIDAMNGEVGRATYDTLFDQWSCPAQYPTWRGVKGGVL